MKKPKYYKKKDKSKENIYTVEDDKAWGYEYEDDNADYV